MRSALILSLILTSTLATNTTVASEMTQTEIANAQRCQAGMSSGSITTDDTSCTVLLERYNQYTANKACTFKQIPVSGPADKGSHKGVGKTNFSGSQLLSYCQQIIGPDWKNVVAMSKNSRGLLDAFKTGNQYQAFSQIRSKMLRYYNDKYNSINIIGTGCPDRINSFKTTLGNTVEMIDEAQVNLLQCMALAAITAQIDAINFSDNDHINKGETSSVDGKIKCVTEGVETQDFPACKHFTYTYSTFLVGQKGVEQVQQINYVSKSMDREEDLAKTSSGTIKKSLVMQRDSLSDQKGMAEQNAAFHGAKGAALLVAYNRIPSSGDATEKCKQVLTSEMILEVKNAAETAFEAFKESIPIEGGAKANEMGGSEVRVADYSNSDPCKEVAENGVTFINQKAKQTMMEMMMQAGVDMLANAGKSVLLNKQIGQMDRAIQGLNEYTASVTIPTFATATATADYCNVNTLDPACADITNRRTYDLGTGGITIGGVGSQTTADQVAAITASDTTGNSTTDRTGIAAPTGSLVDSVIKSSGLEKTIGAASLKDAAPSGGAGGGGGGGVGSVAAPNSGGGGGGDGGGSGGSSGSGAGKMAYAGGGAHSYSGGLGSGAKKGQNAANPLEGLFNKQGPKATGDVLDFRGVASINDKDKDLFKLISNRYESVNKSKRLMEYEAVPK